MFNEIDWIEMVFNILLSSFGGIVNKLVDQEKNPRKKIKLSSYLNSAAISLFVGIFAYFGCKYFDWSVYLTLVITLSAGFTGSPFISRMFAVVTKDKGMPNLAEKEEK